MTRLLEGVVTAVAGDGSLTVTVLGKPGLRVRSLARVSAGDRVVVLQAGGQFLALGVVVR